MDMSKYLSLYLDESQQRLRQIRQLLNNPRPDTPIIQELFRHLHTIKGMSASMGYTTIADLAHRLENLANQVREGEKPLDRLFREQIKEGLDQFKDEFNALKKGQPLLPSLRVRSDLLDELLDNLGELFINNQQFDNAIQQHDFTRISEINRQNRHNLTLLHERVMAMRLTPISFLTERLPGQIAELAKKLGKIVELEIEGEDLEIDRAVLEALDTPLTHLLRNALDHGLETPDERTAKGKNPAGKISISIKRHDRCVQLKVSDDGRGIDPEALKAAALEKNLLSATQLSQMDRQALLMLCCLPGLSTTKEASDISGRGVGLDLVKSRLEALGGHLDISSEIGSGSAFLIELPLSLAMIQALLVEINGQTFGVPLWQLTGTTIVDQPAQDLSGHDLAIFRDESIPLTNCRRWLFPETNQDIKPFSPALVVEIQNQLISLAVDRIAQVRELVLKPLSDIISPLDCFYGVSLLGNGQPILCLDIHTLARHAYFS